MRFRPTFLIWGTILTILLTVGLLANVRDSIRLENYIQRQIESYLSRVLPSNSYLVTVSVDAEMRRTQELKNETVNSYLKEENVTPPTPPTPEPEPEPTSQEPTLEILPGLGNIIEMEGQRQINRPRTVVIPSQEPTRNFREEESKTSKEYGYNEQLDIREVSVQVAFDDSLNPALVQSVKNLIASKMDITFGDRSTVIFSTVDLDQVRQPPPQTIPSDPQGYPYPPQQPTPNELTPQTPDTFNQENNPNNAVETPAGDQVLGLETSEETNEGLDYYLTKYNSIVYLLLSVLIFVILLLLFIFFLWLFLRMLGKNEKKEEPIVSPPQPQNYPPPAPETAIPIILGRNTEPERNDPKVPLSYIDARNREERFLDQFLKEPLISRKYFLSLPDDDKNELLSALVSNAIRSVFRDIANDSSLGQDSIFNRELDPVEVEQIRDRIFNKHIDGINQYNKIYAAQMRDPFSKLSFFTEEEIKTLFNSIGVESAAIIAKNVDSQKMVPYLNQLSEQKRKDFLKIFNEDKEISQGEMEEFKRSFKVKTDDLSKNIFIRKADNKFIKRKLLESSTDKKKFLESIKNDDPDFYNENRSFVVDFNDFLSDEGPLFNRTVQSAENEDITLTLIGIKNPEQRNRILNILPNIRKEFISSYVTSRQGTATRDDIINAQNNILDIYRGYMI